MANKVAQELQLPEKLPITEADLIGVYISPPRIAQEMMTLGNVTTSNYVYYVSVENKLSFIVKRSLERDYRSLRTEYLWPMSRMNTNAAYHIATQLLSAASMDVSALNRDCEVQILAFTPEGKEGQHFVPVYWVSWVKREGANNCAASIELLEPTKVLRQMHVLESKYILRKPLQIENVDKLLVLTNAPAKR